MKTIGLLGGMSWESTQHYYQQINEGIKQQLGGLHSAKVAMVSVDFAPIAELQHQGDWRQLSQLLINAALQVQAAGADALVICSNTIHKVADEIEASLTIPLLHIADATGAEIQRRQLKKVALLGTNFTMEQPFYKQRLQDKFAIEVIIPAAEQRALIHQVIYQELCLGKINAASKQQFLDIIDQLVANGAEAVILGCTEIGMLLQQCDHAIPLLDTTAIHATCAVNFALSKSS
ncbi:aspartate/glutamate racemase family protein [Shewanella sp. C32]|uniref:Aspartate/glutamate racemase family protein n=1 Tax=Shewanella electrica TaxID=515560 RepID=A0ABT2FI58_9GAMM|nr:aspartate/glutamate racemase family protein [Shewanella electrica]MCH1923581.1 aspartate/glutamate racemase family protein [Shewanella electrica]MCS4555677.1 aspartate/glutamate racemase family protein [Shewanella electrica]